jgi:hypothetical protein
MRTTIDLPEELLRKARSRAALEGVKFKDLIASFVQDGLRRGKPSAPAERTRRARRPPPPVIIPRRGVVIRAASAAEIRRIEEEEDEARHARPA